MNKKPSRPEPQKIEKLPVKPKPEQPLFDSEYLNPWNLGRKKIRGKTIISASLPKKLPER